MVENNGFNRVPQFCSVCGSRLVESNTIEGYDPYTGHPQKSSRLRCENPTVTTSRLGSTSKTFHPSWTNETGAWAQS